MPPQSSSIFITIVAILTFGILTPVFGEEPWENEDIPKILPHRQDPDILDGLMDFYQKEISDKTISRCPFYTSCSYFAVKAVKTWGPFWGIVRFLDRFYIRENVWAFNTYLKRNKNGVPKLDDEYFLLH